MNATTSQNAASRHAANVLSPRTVNQAATSPYQPRGEREFGTGYGHSQGYAAARRSYLSPSRPSLFRVV